MVGAKIILQIIGAIFVLISGKFVNEIIGIGFLLTAGYVGNTKTIIKRAKR